MVDETTLPSPFDNPKSSGKIGVRKKPVARLSGRFFAEGATTDDFVEVTNQDGNNGFGFLCNNIDIEVTNGNNLLFSHDGVTTHGKVQGNQMMNFRERIENTIYVKSESSGTPANYIIHAW